MQSVAAAAAAALVMMLCYAHEIARAGFKQHLLHHAPV
jgi:hypothetical protein